jgi:3-oxoacyl-[acyl-carrier protein] reductase
VARSLQARPGASATPPRGASRRRAAGWRHGTSRDGEAAPGGFFQKVDVTNTGSVAAAVEEVMARWGIRSTSWSIMPASLRDGQLIKFKEGALAGMMSDEQFDSVIGVNLRGVFVCTRAVAPRMIQAGGGVILNASSVVGLYGNFGQTNYIASKAGVIGMTRVWARELGKFHIRVNAVAPGIIATDMTRGMPEKAVQSLVAHTPLGRIGQPEDVANAYVWLASDAASFVTGTVLSVDGGVVTGT